MCSRTICPGMQAGSPRRIDWGLPLQQTYLHFQISTDQKGDSFQAIYICLSPETFTYIQMNNEQCVDLPACKITVSSSWASSCILHPESMCRATSSLCHRLEVGAQGTGAKKILWLVPLLLVHIFIFDKDLSCFLPVCI